MPKRYLAVATLAVIVVVSVAVMNNDRSKNLQQSASSLNDSPHANISSLLSTTPGKEVNDLALKDNTAAQKSTANAIIRLTEKFVGGNSVCNPRVAMCE